MEQSRHRLFVYGTLKRGATNHRYLADQTFIGTAQTIPGFTLYGLEGYPGMVSDRADNTGVTGEVWEIDERCLAALDEFEGVPEGLYRRVPIVLRDGSRVETYLFARSVSGRLPLGGTWPVNLGPA